MLFEMDGNSMNELLLELFSEEIPAKMQVKAAASILEAIEKELQNSQIKYNKAEYFVTPRRICIYLNGIPSELEEKEINKKGPKIDARQEAINGFLKAVEMKIEQLTIVDGFYYAKKLEKAVKVDGCLISIIEQVLLSFTWPKSMRSAQTDVRWVRPLRNILCLFSKNILPIKFGHLQANNKTWGHRFMSPNELEIHSFADYKEKMSNNFVILSTEERKAIIVNQIKNIAKNLNLKEVISEDLLNEVAGLVEYPNTLLGKIGAEYIKLPKETLITSMKVHQRYFYLEDHINNIAPYFLTVANVDFEDNNFIILGNEKVLSARLADAKYFWEKDLASVSGESLAKLSRMTFHSKLGSMFDKTNRIIEIAEFISKDIYDAELVRKAALFCKNDLVSEMVGEFPELQGIMGKYYSLQAGYEQEVALAIGEHYRPIDTNDKGDISLLGAIISIADKIDTLCGLWIANEKPTSSKDPFALRRSALGIIKLIRHHQLDISLSELVDLACDNYGLGEKIEEKQEIVIFLNERLKYYLKAEKFRHDLIMASLVNNADNIRMAMERLNELEIFFKKPESEKLLHAIKRIINIVGQNKVSLEINKDILLPVEEKLFDKAIKLEPTISSLNNIIEDIDNFFDQVMINDNDQQVKQNRLNLINLVLDSARKLADFSKIEG